MRTSYSQQQFDGDKLPCDLIMKGGITSGVVYPYSITELATKHRFASVGGTSAGAIAAGIAAAAEYNRAGGGFQRVAEIPGDVGERILSLFQPAPRYRGLFRTFLAGLGEKNAFLKAIAMISAAVRSHWFAALVGALPAIALAFHYTMRGWSLPDALVFAALLVLGALIAVLVVIVRHVLEGFPTTLFGICTGLRQPGYENQALTEWLAEKIEVVAGRMESGGRPPEAPLVFGDLERRDVQLSVMTTNLSMRRPYRLPQEMQEFFWREADFEKLFPDWVMAYLRKTCEAVDIPGASGLHKFPEPEALPVIVAVRMSLSFPVLLCAVPLYTRDFTYVKSEEQQRRARLCWFSDGGISSNFPIHFFDALWPSRPTFAVSLDAYHLDRHGPPDDPANRVYMPKDPRGGILIPVSAIESVPAFIGSIVNSAKDWQDTLQSSLSGYRERIAHIALTDREGGLNLTMPPERVAALTDYGRLAGRTMLGFDFDDHRWRRYLVALARVEETLHTLSNRYVSGYAEFLNDYPVNAPHYKPETGWLKEAQESTRYLMDVARLNIDAPLRERGSIPRPETDMRITPKL